VEWNDSIIVPNYKNGDKTDCSNYRYISLLPSMYRILSNSLLSRLTPYAKEIIENSILILVICSALVKYLRKNGNTMKQCFNSL
jgi:hypothetical protein